MPERKTAIINVSKGLLGVSLAALAAIGGATGNIWLAGAAAVPGAVLTSGLLGPLLDKKKEESLELPAPPWWGHGEKEWLAICAEIETHLSLIVEDAIQQLRQTGQLPTASRLHQAFAAAVLQRLPARVAIRDRVLLTSYVTPLLLEKSSQVLQDALVSLQEENLAHLLSEVAQLLDEAHTSPTSTPTVVSVQTIDGIVTLVPNAVVELEHKRSSGAYDAYMIYAQADEVEVLKIGEQLKERSILPWFAEIDSEPGSLRWKEQAKQIASVPSAAVFVGQGAIDRGQELQIYSFIDQYVQRECKLIPVTLPDTQGDTQFGIFLAGFVGVDFRRGTPEPLGRLIWGITGKRPA